MNRVEELELALRNLRIERDRMLVEKNAQIHALEERCEALRDALAHLASGGRIIP